MSRAARQAPAAMARRSAIGSARRARQQGLGYLAVLFWLALASLALTGEGLLWSMQRQRDREEELLFIGDEMRRAIGRYHDATPAEPKRYPPSLDVLVQDRRFLPPRRHLRRIYADPMTGKPAWGLVLGADGGVTGVYSTSRQVPVKRAGFAERDIEFEHKTQYAEWRFVYHGARTRHEPATMLRYVEPAVQAP